MRRPRPPAAGTGTSAEGCEPAGRRRAHGGPLRRLALVWVAVVALLVGLAAAPGDAVAATGAPKRGVSVSSWRIPVDVTFFGVHDDEGLLVDPTQWGTGRIHAAWCDVAPTATTDVVAGAEQRLRSALKVIAKNDVRRLNLTLGHPGSWLFGSTPNALRSSPIWYCEHVLGNTSFPTRASLQAGPVRDLYVAYVRAVIAEAARYVDADPANRLVLQAWNEPNLDNGGQVKRRIPGAARTWAQAAASLQEQERIIRSVAEELIPGRYEISSPALYGKPNTLLAAYLKAQAKHRTVDSISLNFYTFGGTPSSAMAKWVKKARKAMGLVRARKALRTLPVWITETNHNLVNGKPTNRTNMEGLWASAAVQEHLVEVTTAEAMRLGYAGLEWYQGSLQQVAVNTRAGSVGALVAKAFLDETAGRTLTSCRTKRSLTTCTLSGRDATDPPILMQWSGLGLGRVAFIHPPAVVAAPGASQPATDPTLPTPSASASASAAAQSDAAAEPADAPGTP